MTIAALTEGQLRAQVMAVRAKVPKARFIGIRAPAWRGPSRLRVHDEDVEVAWCVSALAMAERMAEAPVNGPPIVLITDRPDEDLGTDLLVRLAKRRLLSIEPWRVVLDLFQARQLDPHVAQEPWMAEALVDCAPPNGYPAVPSGVLDVDTAWSAVLARFGFPSARIDDLALLRWTTSNGPSVLATAPASHRDGVIGWQGLRSGPAGAAIAGAVRAGRAADAVAIGLAARVVFGAGSETRLVEAAVRLEPLCGGIALSDGDGRHWAELAEQIVIEATARDQVDHWFTRAAAILDELRVRDQSFRSAVLREGFEQRVERLGRAVLRVLAGEAKPAEASAAVEAVHDHAAARSEDARVEVATMADSLLRWLAHAAARSLPPSFPDAVLAYQDDDAWADRARHILRAGDPAPAMSEACRALTARVLATREVTNLRFARLLAAYASAGMHDERLIPVEEVVARIVAPVAAKHPVLLLVLDGMSAGVSQDIVQDLASEWVEIAPAGATRRQVAVSALPSITEVSRTSLFAGNLRRGGASDESRLFAQHPALRPVTRADHPPVVFHKADLAEAGQALAEDVRAAIVSPASQVVAVVVNAVDDHLAKGDQIPVRWARSTIRPLALLLDAAQRAGRIVVLTSDHGHLEDAGLDLRRRDGGGSRWRPAAPGVALAEDEVLLEGPRVLAGGETRAVALATERIRYGTKHSGYHGGATPQEVVVPLVVLTAPTHDPPAGWVELTVKPPPWWDAEPVVVRPPARVEPSQSRVEPQPRAEPAPRKAQLELPTPPPEVPLWIKQLLASPAYLAQRKRSERGAATDDQVTRVLVALDRRGGTMTRAALARALDMHLARVATVLAAVRRLLNVEGYAVLAVDDASDSVMLDRAMLTTQFDLPSVRP
jgi:hypothetical protein